MANISATPSGTYRVNWRDPNDRLRGKCFKRKKDALVFKAQIEAELSRGTYVDPHAGRRLTVREHAARWLAGRTVEAASAARDDSLLRVHVLPRWGDRPLSSVDYLAVQEWVAELSRSYAPATVRECYRLLALIMKSAVRARLLAYNPCDGVKLPARRKKDTDGVTITRDEVAAKLLPAVPDRYRAIVATAAYTGLRWGECAGLRWDVVDLAAGRLRVIRVIVEVRGHLSAKPFPKTAAGRRVVPIPRQLVELLAWHRQEFPSPELVFTDTAGGPLRRTGFRTRVWKPAVRRSGLPERLRFHDLRHSFATWLVSDGVPPNIVQAIMGHEDVNTTLAIYTDVPADYLDRVTQALDL